MANGKELITPNPRAPPSAVKDVEESRQQRFQRQQSRFRDRGGIFVPTSRNTLVDILLGRKEPSPWKRRRSPSCSPPKQQASPTNGKGKRMSLASCTAIDEGKFSVGKPSLRRSPRKQRIVEEARQDEVPPNTQVGKGRKQKTPGRPKPRKTSSKSGKGKATVPFGSEPIDGGIESKPSTSRKEAAARKPRSKRGASEAKESASGTKVDTGGGFPVPARPSVTPKATSNAKKIPIPSEGRLDRDHAKQRSTKLTKGNIVPHETDDDDPPLPSAHTSHAPVSRVCAELQAEDDNPLPSRDARSHRKLECSSAKGKPRAREQGEVDQKLLVEKTKGVKRRLSIVDEENEEEDETSPAPHNDDISRKKPKADASEAKGLKKIVGLGDGEPPPPTKRAETSRPNRKGKAKAQSVEVLYDDDASHDGENLQKVRKRTAVNPMPESEPLKKKLKTVPLHEIAAEDIDHGPSVKPTKRKQASKRSTRPPKKEPKVKSKKQKENTPLSDTSEIVAVEFEKPKKMRGKVLKGPRKSVMIRIQQPLPPIEDNEPDPIDFLS